MTTPAVDNILEDRGAVGSLIAAGVTGYLVFQFWKDTNKEIVQSKKVEISKPGSHGKTVSGSMVPELNFGPGIEQTKHTYLVQQTLDPPPKITFGEDPAPVSTLSNGWNSSHLFLALCAIYLFVNSK